MAMSVSVGCDMWQLTKTTINERIKYLYNNCLMADVHFLVGDSRGETHPRVRIPCHKLVLAVSSPVFYAMFEGKLAEKSDTIDLPDCDSEGFLEFLRFIYWDEARLTGSCVMKLLYLAKKYMVPSLTDCCRRFLEKNLSPDNVMAVLPQVIKLGEAHLADQCWKIVDNQTDVALRSIPFNPLEDKELLMSLVRRDSLNVSELNLFKAVNYWAGRFCKKRELPNSGQQKREVIGDTIMNLIRFPLMTQRQFAEQVVDTKILTESEIIDMFMHFSLPETRLSGFSHIPRGMTRRPTLRCKRFGGSSLFWLYGRHAVDSIAFKVSSAVLMRGIRLFGNKRAVYFVNLKVLGQLIAEGQFFTDKEITDGYYGFDVLFEKYFPLLPGVSYVIEALISGPKSYYGTSGQNKVVSENVVFQFSSCENKSMNGSDVERGQFAEILFQKY